MEEQTSASTGCHLVVRLGLRSPALVAFHLNVRPIFLVVIFVAMWIPFRIFWGWVFFQRRAELDKKIPVRSKEMRKRKKEFFDSLERP